MFKLSRNQRRQPMLSSSGSPIVTAVPCSGKSTMGFDCSATIGRSSAGPSSLLLKSNTADQSSSRGTSRSTSPASVESTDSGILVTTPNSSKSFDFPGNTTTFSTSLFNDVIPRPQQQSSIEGEGGASSSFKRLSTSFSHLSVDEGFFLQHSDGDEAASNSDSDYDHDDKLLDDTTLFDRSERTWDKHQHCIDEDEYFEWETRIERGLPDVTPHPIPRYYNQTHAINIDNKSGRNYKSDFLISTPRPEAPLAVDKHYPVDLEKHPSHDEMYESIQRISSETRSSLGWPMGGYPTPPPSPTRDQQDPMFITRSGDHDIYEFDGLPMSPILALPPY